MQRKMVALWVSLLMIIGCILILERTTQPVRGTTFTVDDDGPANFSKIQDAINASFPGDTIFVHNGTYYENLIVNKTISLIGENMQTTIIDGTRSNNTVFITADWVNVTGFTVRNSSLSWGRKDGGIKLSSADNVTVRDNICTDNLIGIQLYNSCFNIIDNNDCDDNTNSGIRLEIQCKNNIVTNNKASFNVAGIILWSGSSNNVISGNTASSNSPYHGINLDSNCHYNNITDNVVNSNADEGIYLFGNNDNNIIRNNTVSSNGDNGIIISSGSDNNLIYHNRIISNSNQAYHSGSGNKWDNGYPDGGNYWSDFDEAAEGAYDDYTGIDQNEIGSDLIVDKGSSAGGGKNPYGVPGGGIDNYPFIVPDFYSPPSEPRNLTAVTGNGYVNISWEVPIYSGRSNITAYNIYRADVPGIYTTVTDLWFFDSAVQNGVTYTYNVSAENGIGEGPCSVDVNAKPKTKPSEPLNLRAVAGDDYINLYWDEPDDDGGSPVTNYRIYRGETSGGETLLSEIPAVTYFIDSDVNPQTTYYYKVRAVSAGGTSSLSEGASATIITVPSEPTDLEAESGDSLIILTWSPPTSDGGSPVTGYQIYRNTTSDGTIVIFEVGDVLTFSDTTAVNGIEYDYIIHAKNAVGEGPASEGIVAAAMGVPAAPVNLTSLAGNKYVNISWNAPLSDGGSEVTGYNIYRSGTTGILTTVTTTFYQDTDLENGVTYTYNISAVNVEGEGPLSQGCSATPMTLPSAPSNLQLIAGNGYVVISWDPPDSDGGSSIVSYRIYRNYTSGEEIVLVELGYPLFYNDSSVINNRTYYYTISTKNSAGEGPRSAGMNATPKAPPEPMDPLDDEEPVEEMPLWMWMLHLLIALVIAVVFILLALKGRKKEDSQPTEPPLACEERRDELAIPPQEIGEDLPPPPYDEELPPPPTNDEDLPPPPPDMV